MTGIYSQINWNSTSNSSDKTRSKVVFWSSIMMIMLLIQSWQHYLAKVFYSDASVQLLQILNQKIMTPQQGKIGAFIAQLPVIVVQFFTHDFSILAILFAMGPWLVIGIIIWRLHSVGLYTIALSLMLTYVAFVRTDFIMINEVYLCMAFCGLSVLYLKQVALDGIRAWNKIQTWVGLAAYIAALTTHTFAVFWIPFIILFRSDSQGLNWWKGLLQCVPLFLVLLFHESLLIPGFLTHFKDSISGFFIFSDPNWTLFSSENTLITGLWLFFSVYTYSRIRKRYCFMGYFLLGVYGVALFLLSGSAINLSGLNDSTEFNINILLFYFPASFLISKLIVSPKGHQLPAFTLVWVLSLWCFSQTLQSLEPYRLRYHRLKENMNRIQVQSNNKGGVFYALPSQYNSEIWKSVWAVPYESMLYSYFKMGKAPTLLLLVNESDFEGNSTSFNCDLLIKQTGILRDINLKEAQYIESQCINTSIY